MSPPKFCPTARKVSPPLSVRSLRPLELENEDDKSELWYKHIVQYTMTCNNVMVNDCQTILAASQIIMNNQDF